MRNLFFRALFPIVFSLMTPACLFAQEDGQDKEMAPVSGTYAITDATITQAPGKKAIRGNLVLKDGVIISIGKNPPPGEAIIIRGDSLFIYAGFIDGLSHAGVLKGKDDPGRERPKDPGNPKPEVAGITPENDVRNSLNPADRSVEELRALGFTTAQVVPYGGMLPGMGAIVSLNGRTADNMVVEERSALFSQLTGAPRVYPSTVIGVMAKWRELFRQAQQSKNYEEVYASNRNGLSRPASDRILESFYPVIERRMPVLFEANRLLDVHRVIRLQSDLGFSLLIGDIKQGWDAIEKIKASGAKVFLSLDLPEEKADESKKDAKSKAPAATFATEELKHEKETLEKRKAESMALYAAQPSAFQKAGVRFGFSTLSAKPKDIRANIRRMIVAGLTEDQALAALTTGPARLLGLDDRMGTVEVGKIANLVISDKPYFQEKAKVRYVFVEGKLYRYLPGETPATETDLTASLVGTWTVVMESPEGKKEEKITISLEGKNLSGSVTGTEMEEAAALETIGLDASKLSYSYTVKSGGQSFKVDAQATVEGNSFKGTITRGNLGTFPMEATKDPNH
jgi:imidazolonepropionase-like amidohydrolase